MFYGRKRYYKSIEKLINKKIPVIKDHPYEASSNDVAEVVEKRNPRSNSRGNNRGNSNNQRSSSSRSNNKSWGSNNRKKPVKKTSDK